MKTIYALAATIIAAAVLLFAGAPSPAQESTPTPSPTPTASPTATPKPKPPIVKVEQYRRIARAVYWHRLYGAGDYRARPEIVKGKKRLIRMKSKAKNAKALKIMRAITKKQREEWRFFREIDRVTIYGEWAIDPAIVSCESGGVYTKYNYAGSGASGAYQIMGSTWSGYGGGQYASHAAVAPPWAQHIIASRIWAGGSGRGQWEC